MVETIDKIRNRISKLLNKIADLENEAEEQKRVQTKFSANLSLKIIEQKDEVQKQLEARKDQITDAEIQAIHQHIEGLDNILAELGVTTLSSPLDRLADFVEVVGTRKNERRSNGMVEEVVKIGYLQNDELLRPTHIIIVENG